MEKGGVREGPLIESGEKDGRGRPESAMGERELEGKEVGGLQVWMRYS